MVPYLLTTAWRLERYGPTEVVPQGAVLVRMLPEDYAKLADWADAWHFVNNLFPAQEELESMLWHLPMWHVANSGPPALPRQPYMNPSALEKRGIYRDPETPLQLEIGWPDEEGVYHSYESGVTERVFLSPVLEQWIQEKVQPGSCTVQGAFEREEAFYRFEIGPLMFTGSISEWIIRDLFGVPPAPRSFERN